MEVIEVENVDAGYGRKIVLEDISFKLGEGEILAVMGPNGAGKTTLLKVLLGLLKPFRGEVRVLGRSPFREGEVAKRYIGYVPQMRRISTSIPMKVVDVVLMGLVSEKMPPRTPKREDYERAYNALVQVGMEEYGEELFRNLSIGQQQRVLIARALCRGPKLLFLDEPFNGVDVPSQKLILDTMMVLRSRSRMSIIIVTHDVNPIVEITDKVMLLNKKMYAFGAPEAVLKEDVLSIAYGSKIKVLSYNGRCYAIVGDTHGHR